MKHFSLLLPLLFTWPALQAQQAPATGTRTAYFYPKSSLKLTEQNERIVNVEIQGGSKTVFVYEFKKADNPAIADDELSEKIFFVIPVVGAQKSFSYTLSDSSSGIYMKGCYCTDRGYHKIVKGKISGRKLANGNWLLQLNIIIHTGDEQLKPQNRIQKILYKPAPRKA